ncbi:hypothetical protein GGR54DRAFT_581138 [Hypoxylon sp. NC1633]|nr:hypothetical protein GGR54DRAFT_581138 [Hypoxylon sp. NC1633]
MSRNEARHIELLSSLKDIMEAVANPTESIDGHRARIREWLAPTFTEDAYKEALRLRHDSTCDWVLDLDAFREWAAQTEKTSKVFWLNGPAGFGKTVLCARIIHYLQGETSSFGHPLFFFCSSEDYLREHPFSILKSFIGQLLAKDDMAVEFAMKEGQLQQMINDGGTASEADQDYLWCLFRELITQASRCTLVIDGYDECVDVSTTTSKYQTLNCRPYFIKKLLRAVDGTGTRVLLLSRKQTDIEGAVKEPYGDAESLQVIEYHITKENTTGDLSLFSEALFARKLTMNAEKRSGVAVKAVEKSEGMFLWIALLNKRLRGGATRKEVETLVSETPSEIDKAYQRELDMILSRNADKHLVARAMVIFKWVMFAVRPLTVREMAEALAVSFNDSPSEYPADDLPEPFTEDSVDERYVDNYIRMPCGSIIELRKEDQNAPLASHTIHFVHFSVKEFLLRHPFSTSRFDRRSNFGDEDTEHNWIAGLCLQYMCYREFNGASNNGVGNPADFIRIYPFFSSRDPRRFAGLKSSADSGYESLDAVQPGSPNTEQGKSDGKMDETKSSSKFSPLSMECKISPSPVYYAAILGLVDIVERLIEEGHSCDVIGGELGSPLQAAVVYQQGPTIDVLLKHKADASRPGGRYGNPLIAAVTVGSDDTFDQIMSSCKDVNARDHDESTALHHACSLGSMSMVTKLIDAGAELNLQSNKGHTPLVRAIKQEQDKIVDYLLGKGADANKSTNEGKTPLMLAIEREKEDVVRLLISRGADLQCQNSWGETALHTACFIRSAPMTQLLVEHGAAIDAKENDGWMPMHCAVASNSKECADILLRSGASPLVQSRNCPTPFTLAVTIGYTSVVELFNSHESANPSSKDSLHQRLSVAIKYNHTDLIDALVKDLNWSTAGTGLLRDILALTLRTERQTLFHKLAEEVLNPAELDGSSTGIAPEVVWSQAEEKTLKERPWGDDVQKAMALDHFWRRFPGARDILPSAILPIAVANRSREVVELLLGRGADMHGRIGGADSLFPSAFQLAIKDNLRELIALMLSLGRRDNGVDLLKALEETGTRGGMTRSNLTKMLIAHGALDANSGTTATATAAADLDGGDDNDVDSDIENESQVAETDISWWSDTLRGKWVGSYGYETGINAPSEDTDFTIQAVSEESLSVLRKDLTLFSGGGADSVAEFEIHGQVMSGRKIRFVKLYPTHGWMYEGEVKTENGLRTMRGQWASQFGGSPGGSFTLTKEVAA